ncbi:MAG: hypothetical protein J5J06_05800 [Phycisphaerae bacterium]|nr:hypothetical protein [Phycisphaerae bacterium]
MGRNCAAIVLTAWALWVMPVLCVAHVLGHPCALEGDCGDSENHHSHHDHPISPVKSGCGHESGCESDPCRVAVVHWNTSSSGASPSPLPHVLVEYTDHYRFAPPAGWYPDGTRRGLQIPVHLSDLPLQI